MIHLVAPILLTLVSTFSTCPAASVRPHKALEADPTQSPNAGTSPFLQFIEIPAIDSPRTWTEHRSRPAEQREEKREGDV